MKKKSTGNKRKQKEDELSEDDGNLSEDNNPLDLGRRRVLG